MKNIICIDLKSFFASCECVERKLDPFKTPLIVADPKRGSGAITLAVTPYLKKLGVKSRGRLFEIPKNIKNIIVASPRMSLYIKKSKEVINIYLDYVSNEDLHVYSIDEVFIDITNYLKMYKKTDVEIAKEILNTIKKKTGLTATCGIGPNLFLAKVAMDIEAKMNKSCIAKWDYCDVKTKLWEITPLSKVWGIGPKTEKKLNALGIFKIKDLAKFSKVKLIDKFGIIGEELWNHANGIDLAKISEFKIPPKNKSYSLSQILYKDYNGENIKIIIKEMVSLITLRLRENNKLTSSVYFSINYSKIYGGGFCKTVKLDVATNLEKDIYDVCYSIFQSFYNGYPIRKVSIALSKLSESNGIQLNLFDSENYTIKKDKLEHVIDNLKNKLGKNSILKASSLLPDSTIKIRNEKIGGHNK